MHNITFLAITGFLAFLCFGRMSPESTLNVSEQSLFLYRSKTNSSSLSSNNSLSVLYFVMTIDCANEIYRQYATYNIFLLACKGSPTSDFVDSLIFSISTRAFRNRQLRVALQFLRIASCRIGSWRYYATRTITLSI